VLQGNAKGAIRSQAARDRLRSLVKRSAQSFVAGRHGSLWTTMERLMFTAYLHAPPQPGQPAPVEVQVTEYRRVIIHDGKAYLWNNLSNHQGFYTQVTCTFLDE